MLYRVAGSLNEAERLDTGTDTSCWSQISFQVQTIDANSANTTDLQVYVPFNGNASGTMTMKWIKMNQSSYKAATLFHFGDWNSPHPPHWVKFLEITQRQRCSYVTGIRALCGIFLVFIKITMILTSRSFTCRFKLDLLNLPSFSLTLKTNLSPLGLSLLVRACSYEKQLLVIVLGKRSTSILCLKAFLLVKKKWKKNSPGTKSVKQ